MQTVTSDLQAVNALLSSEYEKIARNVAPVENQGEKSVTLAEDEAEIHI
jgi:hypothetical protein